MKSSMDWMSPMPGTVTPASTLKPRAQGRLSTVTRMAVRLTASRRERSHFSMVKVMRFSNTAMMVDRAAKLINTKNSVPHSCPSGIWLNTLGKVTNTSDGPWSGATAKAKQAGKIMRPARMATSVSSPQMRRASPVSEFCLPMRLPNTSMAEMPRDRVKNAWPMAAYTASPKPDQPPSNMRPKSGTR